MEDFLTEHINRSVGDVDLSLALKMGDLEAVKQRLQILAKEKGVIIFNICLVILFHLLISLMKY